MADIQGVGAEGIGAPRRRRTDSDAVMSATGTMRIVVVGLVVVALLSMIITGLLAFYKRATPDAVIGIGSAAVGALATLVARAGKTESQ